MHTPRYLAKILLNSFEDPTFHTLFPDEETKLKYIEQTIKDVEVPYVPAFFQERDSGVPSKAVFESFFQPQKVVVQQATLPKQALPHIYISKLLDVAHTFVMGEWHTIEMRLNAVKTEFRLVWDGSGSGEDSVSVVDMNVSPAARIGKHARALARFVDWDNADLINLVTERILKSKEVKNFRIRIRNFWIEVENLKSMYQFDFEKDIIEAVQKPCTVVPDTSIALKINKAMESVPETVRKYTTANDKNRNP